MIADIIRYIASCLIALADIISTPLTKTRTDICVTATRCRQRKNDIFLTPDEVAKHHIDSVAKWVDPKKDGTWVDPFKNTGVYYDNFPEGCEKDWCEILMGRDALTYDYKDCIVCSNPPYSLITPLLERMVETDAKVISLLIGCLNVSTPRLNKMKEAGYIISDIQLYNVKGYMGTSFAITWMRQDFATWREDDIIGINYKKGGYKTDQTKAIRS